MIRNEPLELVNNGRKEEADFKEAVSSCVITRNEWLELWLTARRFWVRGTEAAFLSSHVLLASWSKLTTLCVDPVMRPVFRVLPGFGFVCFTGNFLSLEHHYLSAPSHLSEPGHRLTSTGTLSSTHQLILESLICRRLRWEAAHNFVVEDNAALQIVQSFFTLISISRLGRPLTLAKLPNTSLFVDF